MSLSLLTSDGFQFLMRYLHFFFGIMWIGHLYYFNFTQGAFMAEADPATKSGVLTKLLPRALWWFRWGAMWTFATGLVMLVAKMQNYPSYADFFASGYGIAISVGALFGITMFANVWFIIWPNQKIVIQSATQVAQGGAALPTAAASGAAALLASRTNTLFSIPMLFYMGAASHLPLPVTETSKLGLMWAVVGLIWLALEINAIKGKLSYMTTVKGVITAGFILNAVIYLAIEVCLRA